MTFDEAMEPLFAYVDGLTDEQRDRIVEAMEWKTCGGGHGQPKCLVQHAEPERYKGILEDRPLLAVAFAFDHAGDVWGVPRVVAALKARAGAPVSLPLPESAREASGVVHG